MDPQRVRDVLQRVGIEQDQVGACAGTHNTRPVFLAEKPCHVHRAGPQGLEGGQSGSDQGAELPVGGETRDVPELRCIRTEKEQDAGVMQRLDEAPTERKKFLPLLLRHGKLRQDVVLLRFPRCDLLRHPVPELGPRRELLAGQVVRVVVQQDLGRYHGHAGSLHAVNDGLEARLVQLPHNAEAEEPVELRGERRRAVIHRLDESVEVVDGRIL